MSGTALSQPASFDFAGGDEHDLISSPFLSKIDTSEIPFFAASLRVRYGFYFWSRTKDFLSVMVSSLSIILLLSQSV